MDRDVLGPVTGARIVADGSGTAPPPLPGRSVRAIARRVTWARFSAITLLLLGAGSAVAGLLHPLSPGFFVSLAVMVNGALEWRGARRLAGGEVGATTLLAWNQIALGLEITAYALWQLTTLRPEMIEGVLARPVVTALLGHLAPDELAFLLDLLTPAVRAMYATVAVVALVGCGATAWFYHACRRHLDAPPTNA